MLKKLLLFIILIFGISVSAEVIQAGISKIDMLPDTFFGTWRVVAKVEKTSGKTHFKENTTDIWNLSRQGDVINLNNPFTGASASVKLDYVEGNVIRFTKTGKYDSNVVLVDTVDLKLQGDTFTGTNYLSLETFSDIDNSLIRKDTAVYNLTGEKISGASITKK